MILQKLKYTVEGPIQMAERYFSIMDTMNNWNLAQKEIQLLAYTSVKENIGLDSSKREFVEMYSSSLATVGNIISKLSKSVEGERPALLSKEASKKVFINKMLKIDFTKDIMLEIKILHNE